MALKLIKKEPENPSWMSSIESSPTVEIIVNKEPEVTKNPLLDLLNMLNLKQARQKCKKYF